MNERFFQVLFDKCKSDDRGFLADVRSADNVSQRYRIYDFLAECGIPLSDEFCLPYVVLGASIARLRLTADGTLTLGKALRLSYSDREVDEPVLQTRFRRLLNCDSSTEFCVILRSNLKLIESKLPENRHLDYKALYKLIRQFSFDLERARIKFAENFYFADLTEAKGEQDVSLSS